MPLLTIDTNTQALSDNALSSMSAAVAQMLGKPESYVMLKYEHNPDLFFAGSQAACALLQLKSLGLSSTQTTALSQQLCQLMQQHFGVEPKRIYIQFESPEREMWGWDNRTFG